MSAAGAVLRTPDARFAALTDYPFAPRWVELEDGLRMHYAEVGPAHAPPVLLLHGEPTWSYLWRHDLAALEAAGVRAIAPDLVGFGRSDKPARVGDYSYARHVAWVAQLLERLELWEVTLLGHDWGSLLGLRLAAEHPGRFARLVIANGALPTGDRRAPLAFRAWQAFARFTPHLPVSRIVQAGTRRRLTPGERAAYDAPFPAERYKAGARAFPRLVPTRPDDPAAPANRRAWALLREWRRPCVTAFSDRDPITRGWDAIFQREVPGAAGQPHRTVAGAGHFLQEDAPGELGRWLAGVLRGAS